MRCGRHKLAKGKPTYNCEVCWRIWNDAQKHAKTGGLNSPKALRSVKIRGKEEDKARKKSEKT